MNFSSITNKPEVFRRPGFLLKRVLRKFRSATRSERITLPWGLPMVIDPLDTIGRQIWVFGLFDLPVCETLWRLTDPGNLAVDAGANIGQMSSLLALRVGATGRVISFEPHPGVRAKLEAHAAGWKTTRPIGTVQIESSALSDHAGAGQLHVPDGFVANCGLASTVSASEASVPINITLKRLDEFIGSEQKVDILKVDVEGAEVPVLHGAEGLFRRKAVRDLVFEHHDAYPSELHRWLEGFGYRIFSLRMHFGGLVVRDASEPTQALRPWDSPSFLATLDPARALDRLQAGGWQCMNC